MKSFSYSDLESSRKFNEEYLDLKDISKENECPYHDPCTFSDDYLDANRDDRQVILCAVRKDPDCIEFASKRLRADREIILAALRDDGPMWFDSSNLRYASRSLKNNKEIVLAAVKANAHNLHFASKKLQTNRAIIKAAAHQDGGILRNVNLSLLQNDIFFHAREKQRYIDKFKANTNKDLIIPDYVPNQDIILAAVNSSGDSLEFAGKGFQNNKKVVLAAVENNGTALQFASHDLQADKEVVIAAVKNNAAALQFASHDLQADKEVVIAAINDDQHGLGVLEFVSDDLKSDKDIVLAAVNNEGSDLRFVPHDIPAYKEVVQASICNNPDAIKCAHEDIFIPLFTKLDSTIMAKIFFKTNNHFMPLAKNFKYFFKHDKEFIDQLVGLYKDHEIFLTTTHVDSD